MIPVALAETIFRLCWFFLLLVAVSAHIAFAGAVKRKGDLPTNALVALPYLIVFACFTYRRAMGTFPAVAWLQCAGLMLMLCGTAGYSVSIVFLRRNWAVSAAVKEGHTLVTHGPYRFVRHPMYFFIMLVIAGSGLLISNYLITASLPLIFLMYLRRARKEEDLLRRELPGYSAYCRKTRMLIPGVF